MHPACPLEFEQWLDIHRDELQTKASELGLYRKLDFDVEDFLEQEYERYCAAFRHT